MDFRIFTFTLKVVSGFAMRCPAGDAPNFDQHMAECREISMAQWNGRTLGLRILQTFLRLFSPLL